MCDWLGKACSLFLFIYDLLINDNWTNPVCITAQVLYYLYSFQTELCELREEVSELKSSRFKADARLRQLELTICEKDADIAKANQELEEVGAALTLLKVHNYEADC